MKKETKQILLVFVMILSIIALCAVIAGCETGETQTDDPGLTIPTKPTETTTSTETTSSTTTVSSDSTSTSTTTTTTTTSNGTTAPVVPVETGSYINPLTGLKTSTVNPALKRPVAIVVDNFSNAYKNQSGLYQADVLYEILVAPGITRYLAIIEDYENLKTICNIRSGRNYHLDIAMGHNAVLVCHGGSITPNYDFYAFVVQKLGNRWAYVDTMFEPMFSWKDYSEKYGTIQNYKSRPDLQYDTVVNGTALSLVLNSKSVSSKFVKNGGTTIGAPKGFNFATSGKANMTGATAATTVNVNFTTENKVGTKYVEFKYDTASGKYIRYQDKKYSDIGETLSFTNVFVLGTTITNVKTGLTNDPDMASVITSSSAGIGYYFNEGKAVKVKWTRYDGGLLNFNIFETGEELKLSTGNTYISYVESAYVTGTTFFA